MPEMGDFMKIELQVNVYAIFLFLKIYLCLRV